MEFQSQILFFFFLQGWPAAFGPPKGAMLCLWRTQDLWNINFHSPSLLFSLSLFCLVLWSLHSSLLLAPGLVPFFRSCPCSSSLSVSSLSISCPSLHYSWLSLYLSCSLCRRMLAGTGIIYLRRCPPSCRRNGIKEREKSSLLFLWPEDRWLSMKGQCITH